MDSVSRGQRRDELKYLLGTIKNSLNELQSTSALLINNIAESSNLLDTAMKKLDAEAQLASHARDLINEEASADDNFELCLEKEFETLKHLESSLPISFKILQEAYTCWKKDSGNTQIMHLASAGHKRSMGGFSKRDEKACKIKKPDDQTNLQLVEYLDPKDAYKHVRREVKTALRSGATAFPWKDVMTRLRGVPNIGLNDDEVYTAITENLLQLAQDPGSSNSNKK